MNLCCRVMFLVFNSLSRFVIAFLIKSNHLLISWLQSPSTVILEPKKRKCFHLSPSICHKVMGLDIMILGFIYISWYPWSNIYIYIYWVYIYIYIYIHCFKPEFSFSSLTLIKRFFSSSSKCLTASLIFTISLMPNLGSVILTCRLSRWS